MQPALLDETTDAVLFVAFDDWCVEEKLNGRRLLLVKRGGVVRCYSRNGVEYVAPKAVIETARRFDGSVTLDGELVGDVFTAFDVTELEGVDMTGQSFAERRDLLSAICPFAIVRHAEGAEAKDALMARVRIEGGEGVVFKRLDGIYSPGSRTYGVKFKFYKTATVRVESVDLAKGSFATAQGRVRFSVSGTWPKVGELWEVRFDEMSANGKMMRPVLLMRRDDLEVAVD